MKVHHGVRIKDSAIVAAATPVAPLYLGPISAGQGHRLDRRGVSIFAHSRLTPCRRDRSTGAARHAVGDREAGAQEGRRSNSRERLAIIDKELAEIREPVQRS